MECRVRYSHSRAGMSMFRIGRDTGNSGFIGLAVGTARTTSNPIPMKTTSPALNHGGRRNPIAACLAVFSLLPTMAFAHPGHYHPPGEADEFDSLVAGLQHPLSGLDHMALALAIGWLALALGGRKAIVPAVSFLVAIVGGALVGRGLAAGAGLEAALACTLIGAGSFFLAGKSPNFGLLSAVAVVAGSVHGFAHGAESMAGGFFGFCVAGFVLSTVGLMALGGFLNHLGSKVPRRHAPRLAGVTLLAMGGLSLIQFL